MQKLKRLTTALCLIFSLCLCLASFALADATGTITDDCVRVRTKPSSDSEVYQQLNKGDTVTVLADADEYGWVKVSFTYAEDGTSKTGYVSKDYLSVDGEVASEEAKDDNSKDETTENDQQTTETASSGDTSDAQETGSQDDSDTVSETETEEETADEIESETESASEPEISEEVSLTATVSGSSVKMRESASTEADTVVTVPEEGIVLILSDEDDEGWMKVCYYDGDGTKYTGYMVGEYLEINAIGTGKANQASVIIRETTDTSSDLVGVIPKDGEVSIYASKDGLYRVEYGALSGWVDASCIDAESEDDCYGYGTVTADLLKLRSKRSTDSDVLTKIEEGTTLQLEGEKNGWYKTTYDGQTGYVSADYIEDEDTCEDGYVQVTATSLSLRSGAGTSFTRLSIIPSGTVLTVSGSLGAWYQVTYGEYTGYVSGEYVSTTTEEGFSTGSSESDSTESASSGSSSSNSSVLAYASQFVGNKYVWGGTSLTNGCDCSGFVMSVFAQFGVSLPHSSSAIRSYGKEVSYSEMQPGDVVCYSGHVGIYAGNGQLLSALNKSKGITYCSVNYKKIITIRRML